MEKEFTYTTVLNGNTVKVTTTLTVSEEEIQKVFEKKQAEFIQSLNQNNTTVEQPASSFTYESYENDSEPDSNYVPYSSVTDESDQTETTKAYTPYASATQMPKSYHHELENGYAPYNSWRVNVPSDKKITIE